MTKTLTPEEQSARIHARWLYWQSVKTKNEAKAVKRDFNAARRRNRGFRNFSTTTLLGTPRTTLTFYGPGREARVDPCYVRCRHRGAYNVVKVRVNSASCYRDICGICYKVCKDLKKRSIPEMRFYPIGMMHHTKHSHPGGW